MASANQEDERNAEEDRPKRTRTDRENEGVRLEKLRILKGSQFGYRGAMNRAQKSLEELLIDPTNIEDVIIEKNLLDKMFTNYTQCCRNYEDSLSHQEEVEHGKMVEEYNSVCRNKEELDHRLEEWVKEAQERPKV